MGLRGDVQSAMTPDDETTTVPWTSRIHTVSKRLAAADRPTFWLAAAAVFLANAVLSLTYGHWALAGLQAVTGLLAVVSAATSGSDRQSTGSTHEAPPTEADERTTL